MTNRDRIIRITDESKEGRIQKILSCIEKSYVLQVAKPRDMFPTCDELTNIIIPAKTQEGKIVVFAHHDVYPGSKGYNDNSSGVVTLLRLQEDLPDNVELVITDGEEVGGQGCRYYLENCMKLKQTEFEAINLDVVGLADTLFYEVYEGAIKSFTFPSYMKPYANIPFSDSRVMESYGIPNVLILTGKSQRLLIEDIWKAEHCGFNDGNIEMISEKTMDLVFDTVYWMIRGKK
jgi:hypothetical protein